MPNQRRVPLTGALNITPMSISATNARALQMKVSLR